MRKLHNQQLPVIEATTDHPKAKEFARISEILDSHHSICVTGGASNLILDCVVLEGNPADSDLTGMMLERQENLYGCTPLKAAFDGGFSSQQNLN